MLFFSFKKAILPQNQRLSGKSSGGGGGGGGGKIFFSHGESNSHGVAVLIAPDTDIKIHSISHNQ